MKSGIPYPAKQRHYLVVFSRLLVLLHALALFVPISAQEELPANSYRESISKLSPMDTEGLISGPASILRQYYDRALGGEDNWQTVQSVRFNGLLHLPQGTVRFLAFKKKPDYSKMVIFTGRGRLVFSYDGVDAWKLNTAEPDAKPVSMPPKEARNFIRDATIGGHLLYPSLEGKEIELVGIEEVEGHTCYLIETKLPDGGRILSWLDNEDFLERRKTTVNLVNGKEEQTTSSDFREVDKVFFSFSSISKSDGEVFNRVEILDVEVNAGTMSWMFQRPSGAYIPGEAPKPVEGDLLQGAEEFVPAEGGGSLFNTDGQTAFPDTEGDGTRSTLNWIDSAGR